MTTMDDNAQLEKQKAEELIASAPAFAGVESVRVELGEDHSGEPSLWLVFKLRPELQADDSWFRAYIEYSNRLSLKLIHSGLTRFPYTRLESAA